MSKSKKKQYERQDKYYHMAKEEGFMSRAAYKIKEIDKKFNLLRRGHKVLDLGAWPGGWLQVVGPIVGPSGVLVGIDFKEIENLKVPAKFQSIVGDVYDEATLNEALKFAESPFDVILSDMSPKLTGIRLVDEGALSGCYEAALVAAHKCLKKGGSMVIKAFKGNEGQQFFAQIRPLFNIIKRCELDSTRKSSNEYYIVCLNFKEGTPCQSSEESPHSEGEQ
ncbi:MAG: RlmE family RNA methyltransferase [bacterium]|nr:RlmE family RNA methyltransferase [bacterium]